MASLLRRTSLFILTFCLTIHHTHALSQSSPKQINRRDVIIGAASLATTGVTNPSNTPAADAETIDMAAIQAARARTSSSSPPPTAPSLTNNPTSSPIFMPKIDPPPLIPIRGGPANKSSLKIPRVGYSLYKTPPDQASRCTALALRTGIRHFDVATLYNSNDQVAKPLKQYLDVGMEGLEKDYFQNEKMELLDYLDGISAASDKHALETLSASSSLISSTSLFAPTPRGSIGRRGRREGLCISHKLSNAEQSTKGVDVRRAVKNAIGILGCSYLDVVSIHSPLTSKEQRLTSYEALLELRDAGFVKSVGVCNYGLSQLREIEKEGLDLPSIVQLELSPFNTHSDVVEYCAKNGIVVSCAAWSKLSGADGPADQWAILAELAKKKGMTKAQVLVRWSLQKGYVCVPRSGCGSKIERVAIGENSYGGANPSTEDGGNFVLTKEEMEILDGLDIGLKAGKLGRRDGWGDEDVMGVNWDPTDIV